MDYALSCPVGLFHGEVFLLQLIKFALEVEILFFLHDLALFGYGFILRKESFGLVMNEVAEDLK